MTPQPHFLQSAAWQQFQEALGRRVITRSGQGWHYLAIIETGSLLVPTRLYCPYGPTVNDPTSLAAALDDLRAQARSHRASVIRVQPLGVTPDAVATIPNLRPISYSQPAHTWQVDLRGGPEAILASMKQSARYTYRKALRQGLSYRESTDPSEVKHLIRLLHGVAAHNHITVHSDAYFRTQASSLMAGDHARLHFMEYQGRVIAAMLSFRGPDTVYYAHAGADHAHRSLGASTALVVEFLLHAAADGYTTADLFGVTDSTDPNHPWAGFTRFKRSFGGQLVQLSPTYEQSLQPLRYQLYRLARSLRSRLG